ncbi:ectonucleoside triphosphate diphosphohydrolase 2 isoform 3-T3 [Acridotheres tristis]
MQCEQGDVSGPWMAPCPQKNCFLDSLKRGKAAHQASFHWSSSPHQQGAKLFPPHRSWDLQLPPEPSGSWDKPGALPEPGPERCAQGEARGHPALPRCHGWYAPAQRGWLGEWIQPQKKTLGAMDFGGASTQITFETRDTIENPRNKVMLKLYGQAYKVYTHSFLCYGRDQVLKRLLSKLLQAESYQATVSHPCWPMGYNKSLLLSSIYDSPCTENERPSLALNTTVTLVGTGNGNLCALQVSKLFDFTNCSFSHCSFDGVFQPKVSGNFIAFSAFFYTVDFIQTVMGRPVHLPSDLKDAAETICATSWSEVGSLGTVGSRGLLHVGYHTGFERTHWVSWHQQIRGKAIYGSYTGLGGGSGGYGQPWPYRCNHPELQATSTRLAIAGLTHLLFLSVHPTQLLQKAPKLEKRLPDYCAVSTFVYLLTTKGYSFNNQSFPNIAFQKKAGETSIGWALGYMLNLTNMIPGEKPSFHKSMLYNYWIILILLFVVTTLTSLVTAICLLRYSKSSII